ncbi:hypothetical protein CFT12S00416_08010 [Campylobacter fetus subsp. testudinum]|uniref:type IV secretory system conjugative DNA transfer family protein n=1 Tax=Campylobacter fetus TaxID=196 RepID=UPI0008189EB4|nr:TraM recognition domain-containing protein [Campylobacter fetus]OCR87760.1 hypothetical protein CFT12S00416_08010 [Campylobacter fetus subsp. testudinum]
MPKIETLEERFYKPYRENIRTLLKKDESFKSVIYILLLISFIANLIMFFSSGSASTDFLSRVVFIAAIVLVSAIALSSDKKKEFMNEGIVKNQSNKKYMINLGFEAKTLYGSAVKTSKVASNLTRPVLLDSEQIKRHMLVMATIGAGKSVFMKGMIEQHILLGGGGLCVDGKGTAEFAKEIYALFAAIGREDDFIHLNFLDMDNTHTINPLLSGGSEAIYEILIALLDGEENEWKAKVKAHMKNILKLLVWRRDNENLPLDFGILSKYLVLDALIDEAIKYKEQAYQSAAISDFIAYISTTIGMKIDKFLRANEETIKEKYEEAKKNKEQGVYEAGLSAQNWVEIITTLKSDYGKVFSTQTPTISMWEAVQRNKFIFVTLPTMSSDTTPKQLGKLILGLIKGVAAEKAAKAIEPKIPFVCWFDEIGSYIITGFGRLESKSRALGISIIPIFQSPAQIDGEGKVVGSESLERREIFDVTGTHILMKNTHPETTEMYSKMVNEKQFIVMEYSDKKDGIKGQMGAEDRYRVEKEAAIKHEEVIGMNNGEMMVFNDGKVYRAVAATESSLTKYGKKITFEGKRMDNPIPITEYVPKAAFLKETYEIYKKLNKDKEIS